MRIPVDVLDHVYSRARLFWPHEACGLLAGPRDGPGPTEVWDMNNLAEHPRYRYAMDPGEQLSAWRAIEAGGHRVFAIFHSHPMAGADMSAEDIRHALDPGVWHLIVSLDRADGLPIARLWQVIEGIPISQTLEVS